MDNQINASCDDSVQAIRENFPDVKLIINQKKLALTKNHNMVIRKDKGKYVLVLNDDTIILDGALKKMANFMDESPDVGILSCKILNPEGPLQRSCGKSVDYTMQKSEMTKIYQRVIQLSQTPSKSI